MAPDGSSTDPVDCAQVKLEEEVHDFRSRFHVTSLIVKAEPEGTGDSWL